MRAQHVEHLVVRPTLSVLSQFDERLYSHAAVKLLMGTAAQESHLGYFLHQIGGGPGKGMYQIEPATHEDIVGRYLMRPENDNLKQILVGFLSRDSALGNDDQLITNLRYATAVARIRYWMVPEKMPDHEDLPALAKYWDDYYNGNPNAGTVDEFLENYNRFVL